LGQDDTLLSVQEIHTYYADSYVLQGLSLELQKGRIVAILGRNGMGKTTLVRSVAGLTPPRSGKILFDGKPIHGLAPYEIARRGIALVPQGRRIFKSLSVQENLLLPSSWMAVGRRAAPKGTTAARWDQEEVLNQFPQLRERIRNLGMALSGGEQQMLAIARALMTNPDLILMDEPSEGLAPRIVQQVGEILIGLRERNHSILLVEQNLALALSVADYIYVLSVGQFVFQGRPDELSNRPEILDRHLGISRSEVVP
jgi:branched-chain amino acid transport system ATP-binding protein